jgi:hypothetical protein
MPSLDLLAGGSVKASGQSVLEGLGKVFLLDSRYRPENILFQVHSLLTFLPGEMYTFQHGGSDTFGNTRHSK